MISKQCPTGKCTARNCIIVHERYENFPQTARGVLDAAGLRRGNIINRCSNCNMLWIYTGIGLHPVVKILGIYNRKTGMIDPVDSPFTSL